MVSTAAVKAVIRLSEHFFMPAFIPSMHVRLKTLQLGNAITLSFGETFFTVVTNFSKQSFDVELLELSLLHYHLAAHDNARNIAANAALEEGFDDVCSVIKPGIVADIV